MTTKTKAPTIEAARSSNADKLPSASTCAVGGENGASIKPGVFRGMKAADYHAIDAFSNSLAGHMLKSAAHGRHYLDNPPDPNDSMRIGTAVDAIIFGTKEAIAIMPECDRRTKEGKAIYANFIANAADKTVVTADEWAMAEAMAASVNKHPAASRILSRVGPESTQVAVVWIDEDTGILCKGLIDILDESVDLEGDLKSTRSASPVDFGRSIYTFGYARQRATYAAGLAANGIQINDHVLIAVENEAPFATAVYRLRDEDLERGHLQFRRAINRYATCKKLGEWPGYSHRIQDITLPAWAAKQIEEANDGSGS